MESLLTVSLKRQLGIVDMKMLTEQYTIFQLYVYFPVVMLFTPKVKCNLITQVGINYAVQSIFSITKFQFPLYLPVVSYPIIKT